MGEITIHLPQDLEMSIDKLVSGGLFGSKEEAVVALVRKGLQGSKKKEAPVSYTYPGKQPAPPVRPPEKWPDHFEFK